jgi:hypothetical protein
MHVIDVWLLRRGGKKGGRVEGTTQAPCEGEAGIERVEDAR